MSKRDRDLAFRNAARRDFARLWDFSVAEPPAASLLDASIPLRKERHRQRYQMGFVS